MNAVAESLLRFKVMNNNHFFTLFDLPICFDIDKTILKQRFLDLQKQHHPDRLKKISQDQQAALINHAFNTLNKDELRAIYLLELAKIPFIVDDSIDDKEFLSKMMHLRIALEEGDADEITLTKKQISEIFQSFVEQFQDSYNQKDWQTACNSARKLKFLAKLQEDAHEKLSQSLHADNDEDDLYV